MAGYMYLGIQKVRPAISLGGNKLNVGFTVDQDGKITREYVNLKMSGFKSVGSHVFEGYCSYMDFLSVDLSCIEVIDEDYACRDMFRYASLTSLDLSNLKSISGEHSCDGMFSQFDDLISVDLSSLETINGNYACAGMFTNFRNKSLISVDLSSLKTINGTEACWDMFFGDNVLTSVDLSNLESISGSKACGGMFAGSGIKSLSLPSLKTILNTDSLVDFIGGCTDVTIHFPSNMQSIIQGLSGYPNFGGTNTTLLFDLPSTE